MWVALLHGQVRSRPLGGDASPAFVDQYSNLANLSPITCRYAEVADLSPGKGYEVRASSHGTFVNGMHRTAVSL